jgi:hypothetical protein
MKVIWLEIRMMARKKKYSKSMYREAHDWSDIAIHMMSWGDYICNLLWWIRLC